MTPWLPKTSCGIHICGCGPCPVALVQHISRPQTSELCPHTKKVSEDGGRGGGGPPLIHNIAIVPKIPPSRKMGIYFPKLRITLGPTVQFHRLRLRAKVTYSTVIRLYKAKIFISFKTFSTCFQLSPI